MSWFQVGPNDVTTRPNCSAMSPDRCGPLAERCHGPEVALLGGSESSNRTRKKLSSSAAIAVADALTTSSRVIGGESAASQECFPHSWTK